VTCNIIKFTKNILLFPTLILCSYFFVSCSSSIKSTGHFVYVGRESVYIDSMDALPSINANDTLFVKLWSKEISRSMFDSLSVLVTRNADTAFITAGVAVYDWVGDGLMPPTSLWPLSGYLLRIAPPFNSGSLKIVAVRPDNTKIEKTVMILP
jgi:hypothetical protein